MTNSVSMITRCMPIILATGLGACNNAETTYMLGTLERDRIELKVESSEPIIAIHSRDGQLVAKGDPILDQDPQRAEARLAQQIGFRNQVAARLSELKRGPREESIREARARLKASRVLKDNALANLERTREVFAKALASEGQLDRDETSYETALAQEEANKEALETLLHGTTSEELEQAEAAVDSTEAAVRQAQLDLDRTRIRAPADGIIDKVLFQLGERPPPGTTVAVLLDNSRTYARVYVPEYLRADIVPGASIEVRIDGMDHAIRGRVRWVSSDASFTPYFALTEHDRSRLSYLAEIDIPDAANLPTGIPVQADFPGK